MAGIAPKPCDASATRAQRTQKAKRRRGAGVTAEGGVDEEETGIYKGSR